MLSPASPRVESLAEVPEINRILTPMDKPLSDREARAARRRETWAISVHTLADAPPSERTTPEVALASMWRLACETWAMSGRPWPDYTRANMPGRVIRAGDGAREAASE